MAREFIDYFCGKHSGQIPVADIAYFTAEQKCILAHTKDGKEIALNKGEALYKLQQEYPAEFELIKRGLLVRFDLIHIDEYIRHKDGEKNAMIISLTGTPYTFKVGWRCIRLMADIGNIRKMRGIGNVYQVTGK